MAKWRGRVDIEEQEAAIPSGGAVRWVLWGRSPEFEFEIDGNEAAAQAELLERWETARYPVDGGVMPVDRAVRPVARVVLVE